MKSILIILLLINFCSTLVLANTSVFVEQKQDSIRSSEYYNTGEKLFYSMKYNEADSCFKKAIELDSNNYFAKIFQIKSNYNYNSDLYNEVQESYTRVINKLKLLNGRKIYEDSALGMAYNERARIFMRKGNYEEAKLNMDSGIVYSPRTQWLYSERAELKKLLGDITGAIDDLSTAIEFEPTRRLYYNDRSVLYQQIGEYLKEAEDLTRYMNVIPKVKDEFNPDNMRDDTTWRKPKIRERYERGLAYFNAKHYQEALEDFEFVMPIRDSLLIESFYYIGHCKLYLGDTLGACAT